MNFKNSRIQNWIFFPLSLLLFFCFTLNAEAKKSVRKMEGAGWHYKTQDLKWPGKSKNAVGKNIPHKVYSSVPNTETIMSTVISIETDPGKLHKLPKASSLTASTSVALATTTTQSNSLLAETPADIKELARALEYDANNIYEYMQNNFDFTPYSGSLKGPYLTFLDKSGNDFDQAALMVTLLRESGYTAQYLYKPVNFSLAYAANWLGVEKDMFYVTGALANAGMPIFQINLADSTVAVMMVTVKVTIDGTAYEALPAVKLHEYIDGIDIRAALGYDRNALLSDASIGATLGGDYVKNLNEGNISEKLTEYATNLINTIKNQYPNHSLAEIIDSRSITPVMPGFVEYTPQAQHYSWDEIPSEQATFILDPQPFVTTIRIQHRGIDKTLNMADVAGNRLTVTYAGANLHPELRLNGTLLQASNLSTTAGVKYDCAITIDHPFLSMENDWVNGTITFEDNNFADQTNSATPYKFTSGSTYAIITDFGGNTDEILAISQRRLAVAVDAGNANTAEPVLGEGLNLIGQSYFKQGSHFNHLLDGVTKRKTFLHHSVGVVAHEEAPHISVDLIYTSSCDIGPDSVGNFIYNRVGVQFGSAFEHGVLEQVDNDNTPALSTIKVLQVANNAGTKIYRVDQNNFTTIAPILENGGYSNNKIYGSQASSFQSLIDAGGFLVLPENGTVQLDEWQGYGYVSVKESDSGAYSYGMIISSGIFGGYYSNISKYVWGLNSGSFSSSYRLNNYSRRSYDTVPSHVSTFYTPSSRDPIDLASGSFEYGNIDMVLGQNTPLGLFFKRSYSSIRNLEDVGLGFGWTHNYDIHLDRTSHSGPTLGLRQPIDVASTLAAIYVNLDIMQHQPDLLGWTTSALIAKWGVDRTINNAFIISFGDKTMEYIKQPDGSFSAPAGITATLIDNGNDTYTLQERFGTRYDFNSKGKITTWTDVDANTLAFYYYPDNKLQTVQDSFNHSLIFQYLNDKLDTVSDSTGRSVSFAYNDGDLVTYTDLAQKDWTYGYDLGGKHLMTTLKNPLRVTTATNIYDERGKVKIQTVPRVDALGNQYPVDYTFYFSGFRNIEEDPDGHQTIYHFDYQGRNIKEIDALGHTKTKKYDGQDHVVEEVDKRGNLTKREYDDNNNLRFLTNAYDKITEYQYDTLFRMTDAIDPLHHATHYDYYSDHHLWKKTLDLTGLAIVSDKRTYHDNGLLWTSTDGNLSTTTILYDRYGNTDTSKVNSHPLVDYTFKPIGLMTDLLNQEGAATHFEYDDRGLVTLKRDPLLRETVSTYYDDGNLWTKTDRKLRTTNYTYTPNGKADTITYQNGSTVKFTYNHLDLLESMTDAIGTTSYTAYDAVGRVKSITDPHGFQLDYKYDEAGNLTEITYPSNKRVLYGYDALNRMETVTLTWLSQTATYHYDDAGRLDYLEQFNGTTVNYDYDNANRLTLLENLAGAEPIATYAFTELDGNGNPKTTNIDEPLAPAVTVSNISYTYNQQRNRMGSDGSKSFTYDLEGQLDGKGATSYTFDYEHRLTNVNDATHQIQYSYDGIGNLLAATRNGIATRYVYDQNGNLIAEADETNTILRYYIHGKGLLAMVNPANDVYCYHFNSIGSTTAMTDSSQTMVNKYAYTPFGVLANEEETVPQPFKFVGIAGVMTEPNGFNYMRARYYDSEVRRFISEDPTGFAGGDLNLYAYVGNNPMMFMDPTGLMKNSVRRGVDSLGGERMLDNFSTGSAIATGASAETIMGPIVFGTIGTSAFALKNYLYSEAPVRDSVQRSVLNTLEAASKTHPAAGLIVGEAINQLNQYGN